jgi:hypothetical protein
MYPFLYQLQENEYVVVIGSMLYEVNISEQYLHIVFINDLTHSTCIGEYPLFPKHHMVQSYHTFFDELSAKKFIKEWWANQTF